MRHAAAAPAPWGMGRVGSACPRRRRARRAQGRSFSCNSALCGVRGGAASGEREAGCACGAGRRPERRRQAPDAQETGTAPAAPEGPVFPTFIVPSSASRKHGPAADFSDLLFPYTRSVAPRPALARKRLVRRLCPAWRPPRVRAPAFSAGRRPRPGLSERATDERHCSPPNGSRGEVQPLLGLAVELRALGHEAVICAAPNFQAWVESFGIAFVPIGPDLEQWTRPDPAARQPPTRPSPEQWRG